MPTTHPPDNSYLILQFGIFGLLIRCVCCPIAPARPAPKMKSKIHTAMRGHTLQSLIDQRAEESPAQTFFISPESGRQINYEKLRDSICGCGKALASVPHGGTVGGMLGNGWAAVQLLLAAPYHGRRVMLINLAAGDAGACPFAQTQRLPINFC